MRIEISIWNCAVKTYNNQHLPEYQLPELWTVSQLCLQLCSGSSIQQYYTMSNFLVLNISMSYCHKNTLDL